MLSNRALTKTLPAGVEPFKVGNDGALIAPRVVRKWDSIVRFSPLSARRGETEPHLYVTVFT